MSLKGILGGIDVDVIPEQYSTDQSPPGLLGTYKRLDGIKGCEYRTSSWHWVSSIYCTNLRHSFSCYRTFYDQPAFLTSQAVARNNIINSNTVL